MVAVDWLVVMSSLAGGYRHQQMQYTLWSNLANLEYEEADIENLNQYGEGQFLHGR